MQKIKIMVSYSSKNDKPKKIEIDADVFGPLAVHQTPFGSGWTITHVKTGYAITGDISNKRGAYALVKAAAKRPELFENLSTKDREKNKQAALYFRTCREKIKSAHWENL